MMGQAVVFGSEVTSWCEMQVMLYLDIYDSWDNANAFQNFISAAQSDTSLITTMANQILYGMKNYGTTNVCANPQYDETYFSQVAVASILGFGVSSYTPVTNPAYIQNILSNCG